MKKVIGFILSFVFVISIFTTPLLAESGIENDTLSSDITVVTDEGAETEETEETTTEKQTEPETEEETTTVEQPTTESAQQEEQPVTEQETNATTETATAAQVDSDEAKNKLSGSNVVKTKTETASNTTKPVPKPPTNGWFEIDNTYKYYKKAVAVSGWQTIGDSKYYFDPKTKIMATGLKKISGKWYYFGGKKSGKLRYGWITVKENTYFANKKTGVIQTGWKNISGKRYYFDPDKSGKMVTGFKTINKKIYYLDPKTGVMQTGWKKIKGKWYWFRGGDDGSARTGWQTTAAGNRYYLYPKTGAMATGVFKVGKTNYYYDKDGKTYKGWKLVNKKWYFMLSGGKLKTGWYKSGNYWYYLDPKTAAMRTGWVTVNKKTYLLEGNNSGRMLTGWQKVKDKWYYMQASGERRTGWLVQNKKEYYLDTKTGERVTGAKRIGSVTFHFDKNGVRTKKMEYTYDKNKLLIFLDPGHDATHRGAANGGFLEDQMNMKIALACKKELETYKGVRVILARNSAACPYPGTNEGGCIRNRVEAAAKAKADVYISLHINASGTGTARGIMTIPQVPTWKVCLSEAGRDIGDSIRAELLKLGFTNWGTYYRYTTINEKYPDGSDADYYSVTYYGKQNNIPSVIIEHGYIDNDDLKLLNTDKKLEACGKADATGIANYYGLTKK